MQYKKKQFIKLFTRETTIQRLEIISNLAKFGKVKHLILIPTGEGLLADFWFEQESWKKYCNSLYPKMIKKDWLVNFIKKYEKGKKVYLNNARFLFKKYQKLSVQELFYYYNTVMMMTKSSWGEIMWQPWALDEEVIPKIKEKLIQEVGKEKLNEIWDIINLPTDFIAIQKIQLRVFNAYINNDLDKEIENLVAEYSWITVYNFRDAPANKEYFLEFIKNLSKDEAQKKIDDLQNYIKNNKIKFNGVIKNIKNKELKRLLKIVNFYVVFRTHRIEILKENFYCLSKFFDKFLKYIDNKNWNFDDVINLTYIEIRDHFKKNKKLPSIKEIKERQNLNYIHYYIDGKFGLIKNSLEMKKIRQQISQEINVKELKGNIACGGKVKGLCKLVFSVDQLDKVKKGDILVTPMTFTEYLPAMNRAVAFVTNEGGITCHAAIIAREMKKPCIIGTKNATQILKDGDLVEVDAEKGVVKIIKS